MDVQPVSGQTKRFSDVCGVDEAKQELLDIVKYLRSPKQFTRLGGKLPKGCLLTGPPGTGRRSSRARWRARRGCRSSI